MSGVLPFVLAAMQSLIPNGDHAELGGAIAERVDAEAPLFSDDADRRKTASYLAAIAYRESALRLDAVGDKGTSYCAFQLHRSSGGTRAMLTDARACVGHAFGMLRTSMRACPAHPLAIYAEGPRGCSSPRAQRISRDRLAIAARLRARVLVTATEASESASPGFAAPIGAAVVRVSRRRSDEDSRGDRSCVGGAS